MNSSRFLQTGASLMEVLVAMSISLVVTASMIALMSNSLSSTARIVKMTKLSDDMRVTMQMMTRDVRRSNFNGESIKCYANDDCLQDGSVVSVGEIGMFDMNDDSVDDCFWFLTDRSKDNYMTGGSGPDLAANARAGAFRHRQVDPEGDGTTVGVIEMWTGSGGPDLSEADPLNPPEWICDPPRTQEADWVAVTDPEDTDIFGFSVDDDLSYTQVIQTDPSGNPLLSQRVRTIRLTIEGGLRVDQTIVRRVQDVISVRNDLLIKAS